MKWRKKGLVFESKDQYGWISSHAQIPTVLVLNDRIRVYIAVRPKQGVSYTATVDLDRDNPEKVITVHERPVLFPGDMGCFDEHGAMPNFVWKEDGKVYLYYVGWSRRTTIPYSNWMGVAVSDDDGLTFAKLYRGPVFDRTREEILSATGLFFVKAEDEYVGFYASGTRWYEVDGSMESAYEIVQTRSVNLVDWKRDSRPVLPTVRSPEANTRPTVVKIDGVWHMWFCYRGVNDYRGGADSYRIGYAYSRDLNQWERSDADAGIEVSAGNAWDSLMLCYPYVVDIDGRHLMFYNGNGFGQSGFGYAELEM